MAKVQIWSSLLIIFIIIKLLTIPLCDSKNIFSRINSNTNEVTNSGEIPQLAGTSFFTRFLPYIFRLINVRKVIKNVVQGKGSEGACTACKFGISMLQHLVESGKGKNEIAIIAKSLCVDLKIESARVCNGIVDSFKDEFVEVFSQLVLSPNELCGVLVGESCAHVYNPLYNWTIPLTPIPKPTVKSFPSKFGAETIKVLQISDTHIDPLYEEGGDAACGEPLCCRKSNRTIDPSNRAGYWGDYRDCDIPIRTFEETLRFINNTHKDIDYVLWTGDIPPHDIWNQTREGQIKLIRQVSHIVNKYFGNIPIFPALGNHESAPVNSFPMPEIEGKYSISWLYDALEDIWSQWLPKESSALIKKGAFYSVRVRPGLKLVSLNMNYCSNQNWWLLLNAKDPAGELQYLIYELQESELIGEKVHIIGHIPPGSSDCLQVWSRNYYRIVNRYESTITGQFFGHTHQDEFELFYDNDQSVNSVQYLRPTNIAYICPSLTPFGNVNPGYRIYTIDKSSYTVLDHETYYLNLNHANLNRNNRPLEFQLSYSAKSAYQLKELSPIEWHNLVMRMKSDDKLFQVFYDHFFNRCKVSRNDCIGSICKNDILCRLITGKSNDFKYCRIFLHNKSLF